MRLDRLVTLSLTRPLAASGLMSRGRALPILMYHSISDDPQLGVSPYYKTVTNRAVFEQQMRRLAEQGFKAVTLGDALRILESNTADLAKLVVITFDDGFRDFYNLAFPVLQQYGHTATMYLPTAFIGKDRRSFKDRECMTWDEVRELRSAGIEFGWHTVSHPKLYELSWGEIENELTLSKQRLDRELDEETTGFAYPFAFPQQDRRFAGEFKELLKRCGYRHCATTILGRARSGDDFFCLKRLPVNVCDDQAFFDAKLQGAYDWLAYPQGWHKALRHRSAHAPMGAAAPAASTPQTL